VSRISDVRNQMSEGGCVGVIYARKIGCVALSKPHFPTDKRNHDRDAMREHAAIDLPGRLLLENLSRFSNCKICVHLGLSGIILPAILARGQYIPMAMPCLIIFEEY